MTEQTLVADDFVCGRGVDDPNYIRLRFTGGGDALNIIIPIDLGQTVAREIEHATVQSAPQPIGADEMKLGAVFRLIGHQVRSGIDGGKRLVLTVRLDSGAREIPIELSADDAVGLVVDLSR